MAVLGGQLPARAKSAEAQIQAKGGEQQSLLTTRQDFVLITGDVFPPQEASSFLIVIVNAYDIPMPDTFLLYVCIALIPR